MRTIPYILSASLFVFGLACSPATPQAKCGPLTCAGCCDPLSDRCFPGLDTLSCGRDGQACAGCSNGQSCTSGICSFSATGGGTGGGMTGTGGGTTGTGGGMTGTGGGTTGGGTGGGATTGGGTGTGGGAATGGGTTGGGTGTGGGAATGGGTTGGGTGTGGSSGTCATNCVNPPGPRCLTANTAVTSASTGTCVNAQCAYAQTQTACPYGCVGTTCAGPSTCAPSSRRCNGTQIQTCNSNGSAWLFAQNCSGTCTNGLCDAPCTPGAIRCNGATVETCNVSGTAWALTTSCTSQCLAGACLTDELLVNGVTVQMEGERHYNTRVRVFNGGQIQVPVGRKLSLFAPSIIIDVSSSMTGSSSGGTCVAAPDDVEQGIKLIANQVTINGTLSWTAGSCSKHGLVVRAGLIDGPGTVTTTGRNQLLYGAGGVAPGLVATTSVKSLMPPAEITSSTYPEGRAYNDDGPPALFSWSKPATTVTGYYYVVGSGSAVPTATSTFIASEALGLSSRPSAGKTYVDLVSLDSTGVVGTVPHEFELNVLDQPPALSSSTNPVQGTWSANPTVVMAWDGGNPGVGYYQIFDRYPSTRPTPQTGAFEPTNKSPAQTLFQNVSSGRWWFHMVALDSMGYSTRRAAHYEVDLGNSPDAGTIAGTVKDSFDAGIVGATVVVQRGLYTATTVAGGVYTFPNTIPEGTYEVVAKKPDAGVQAEAMTLTVTAGQTTEGYFSLPAGFGCPTCADLCSGTACTSNSVCSTVQQPGTCNAGVCMQDTSGPGSTTLALGSISGNTTGRPNSVQMHYSNAVYCTGPDVIYAFTAPTSRGYTFAVSTTAGVALQFYMTTNAAQVCSNTIAYQSPWWFNIPNSGTAALSAGQTIYIIVDGSTPADFGPFTITVT